MKSDLDRLMLDAALDALLVVGGSIHNPAMYYFTGGIHLLRGFLIKKRGEAPVLFHPSMEREEAARSGLAVRDLSDFAWNGVLHRAGGERLAQLLAALDVRGRVAVFGRIDVGPLLACLDALREHRPEIELATEFEAQEVLARARATKSEEEVERIRRTGRATVEVVGNVADFLTSHRARHGVLVNQHDEVLTIGEVKRRVNLWLAMKGLDNPEGCIFSVGRDAAIPHSTGIDSAPVETGKTIIFDIFPCEARGGYFFDFTRTWVLGEASDEILAAHRDVLEAYQVARSSIRQGVVCGEVQLAVCQSFEARGHPTVRTDAKTTSGYVHTLGHGVGLDVQEQPFTRPEDKTTAFAGGMVFTIEPGLYYPERGLGVRLEDTVWLRPDGILETLADFPMDLTLRLPGA
jgi:Xaa-Pro aminopeptidase